MNLHAIVAGYVAAVNPWLKVIVKPSIGYGVVSPDGTRAPIYGEPYVARAQVQSLTFRDLTQMAGLNVEGERRAIYLSSDVEGVLRPDTRGGDLIIFPDYHVWLVAMVLENWITTAGWVKVAVTRQQQG